MNYLKEQNLSWVIQIIFPYKRTNIKYMRFQLAVEMKKRRVPFRLKRSGVEESQRIQKISPAVEMEYHYRFFDCVALRSE